MKQSQILTLLHRLADHSIETWSSEILTAIKSEDQGANLEVIASKLSAIVEKVYEHEIRDLLQTLDFPSRVGRKASIDEADVRTFDWVYSRNQFVGLKEPRTTFQDWLQYGGGIFWIAGKAGSGKSTLMRYIANERRTLGALRDWAGDSKLMTASCFFFHAGDRLQKSQEGLVRSILYDILSQCSDLVPKVFPERLHDRYLGSRPWKTSDLLQACSKLTHQLVKTKFCFFLDGLDEYDGEHRDVMRILLELAKMTNIKICFSSRSWNVFQETFGDMYGSVTLEEHTNRDIEIYVIENLKKDGNFSQRLKGDPQLKGLIDEIIRNAQGVFLWVRLAVNDVLRGSANKDSIHDLQHRLRYLPRNLETYCQRAFDNIDKFYREATAEVLLLAQEAVQPLPILAIEFYQREKYDPSTVPRLTASEASLNDFIKICRTRLNSRCQDFLIVRSNKQTDITLRYTVEFLHATAAEFVKRREMKSKLASWVSDSFNPRLTLLKGTLASVRYIPSFYHKEAAQSPDHTTFVVLASQFLEYAYRLEKHDHMCDIDVMAEFDQAAQAHWSSYSGTADVYDAFGQNFKSKHSTHWAFVVGCNQTPRNPILPHRWDNFMTIAIKYNLQLYVAKQLDSDPDLMRRVSAPPLLYYALSVLFIEEAYYHQRGNPMEMIQVLLDRGAQPHEHFKIGPYHEDVTVFGVFLGHLYQTRRHGHWKNSEIFDITMALAKHGSDPRLIMWEIPLIIGDGSGWVYYHSSTNTVLETLFTPAQVCQLESALNNGVLKKICICFYWLKRCLHPFMFREYYVNLWFYIIISLWFYIVVTTMMDFIRYSNDWMWHTFSTSKTSHGILWKKL